MPAPIPRLNQQEVFTQPVSGPQASGEMGGVADAYRALGEFGNQVQNIATNIAKPGVAAAGAEAVQRDENGDLTFKPRLQISELDELYNHAGLAAYTAQSDTDRKLHFQDLRNQNVDEPEKFVAGSNAWLKAQVSKAPPSVRGDLLARGRAEIAEYTGALVDQKRARDAKTQRAGLESNIKGDVESDLLPLARAHGTHTPEFLAAANRIRNWSDALKNPVFQKSGEEIDNEFAGYMKQAAAEAGLGTALKVYQKDGKDAAIELGDKVFYGEDLKLPLDTADKYHNRLHQEIAQAETEKRQARLDAERGLKDTVADAQALAGNGGNWEKIVSREELRTQLGDGAQPVIDHLDWTADTASYSSLIATASPAELAALGKSLDPNRLDLPGTPAPASGGPRPAGYAADLRRSDAFHAAVQSRQKALDEDPAAYVAATSPHLQGLAQAQQGDPHAHTNYVGALLSEQARLGVPLDKRRILSKDQVEAVTTQLTTGPADGATGLLRSLASGLPNDEISILSKQIAPKNRAVAVALSAAGENPTLASDILLGDRFISQNPDVKPSEKEVSSVIDRVTGGATGFLSNTGGLFQFAPDARTTAVAAGTALYARQMIGGKPGAFDQGKFEDSLKQVLGNPLPFRGQIIVPPRHDMTASDMNGVMGRINEKAIAEFGNGKPVDASGRAIPASAIAQHGVLTYTGSPGLYRVMFPGQGHLGVVGNSGTRTFMIDLGRMVGGDDHVAPPPPPVPANVPPPKAQPAVKMKAGKFLDWR